MPEFMKSAGRIFDVRFTANEKRAINEKISSMLSDAVKDQEKEELAIVAWVIHQRLGYQTNGITNFLKDFYPLLRKLYKEYDMNVTDAPWLCSRMLKEDGIDFDAIYSEVIKSD